MMSSRTSIRGLVLSTMFFSVFCNLLMLTGPLFMLQVYDRVLASRSEETLVALTLLMGALYLFLWILDHARGRVMALAGARVQSALAGSIFRAVIDRAALRRRATRGTLHDLDTVRSLFASPVLMAMFDMPWTPVFLVAIFIFHPLLGWLAILGGGVLIAAAILNQILTGRTTAESARLMANAQRLARQAEDGGELVRAQGMGPVMADRWLEVHEEAVDRTLLAGSFSGSITAFTKAFRLFLQSAVLALGAWLVLEAELTAGAMIAASILLGRALAPIEIGVSQWVLVQRSLTAWRDLRALLGETPLPKPRTELPAPAARLDVRGLSVAHDRGSAPILDQVSFGIAPGEALGVIGRSGSGKSTLARALVGLGQPVMGEVRLGGVRLDQYGPERLGRHIGYLPQEVQLFDGTVAENIAQMDPHPDSGRVVEAARKALVHDTILSLPDGYDTRIGSGATLLSGGKKQRLALARALYGDPVLLVLDEPNSALDAEGSQALNAVVSVMKAEGRCVLMMTHRPTALTSCDRLLVLEGGRVAGCGPRDEVIRAMMTNADDVQRLVKRRVGA
jgi:ATP-binding cassette subfamily C protein